MRIILLAALLSSTPAFASSATVVDGDTIKIDNVTHRLHGIDAPEEGQKCKGGGKRGWSCGKRVKINLNKGERWFCTEAEAVQAGWRAPHWR